MLITLTAIKIFATIVVPQKRKLTFTELRDKAKPAQGITYRNLKLNQLAGVMPF